MKKIFTLLLIISILASCGGEKKQSVEAVIETGNLTTIKNKKKEVEQEQQRIANELQMLNTKIADLDTVQRLSQITTTIDFI